MITIDPQGGLRFSMHIDELLLMKMPQEIMAIASAQLASELVEQVGKKMLEEMDAEAIKQAVTDRVIEELAGQFEIIKTTIRPVVEEAKENKETATDEMRRMRGAK